VTNLGLHDARHRVQRGGEDIDALVADVSAQVAIRPDPEPDENGWINGGLACSSFVARDRAKRPWQRRWAWYYVTPLDPAQEPDPATRTIFVTGDGGYTFTHQGAIRRLRKAINDHFEVESDGTAHRIVDDAATAFMWTAAVFATWAAYSGSDALLPLIGAAWAGAAVRGAVALHWKRTHPTSD
jgi:hypothetical protein